MRNTLALKNKSEANSKQQYVLNYPKFNPRHYQQELLDAFFIHKRKRFFYLCHRRAGKDMTCWNLVWGAALQRVGTYLYLLPQHNQARRVIWRGIIGDGRTFLGMIPKILVRSINNTNMSIELINGSIIQLGGGKNFDTLMGTNPVGIVLSEFALHSPLVLPYLSPILVENNGWLICQTTPRGKNHAYKLFHAAIHDDTWMVRRWSVEDTKKLDGSPVITPEQIEAERKSGVPDELIKQEWFLSFDVGNVGAYYTSELDYAEYDGRICNWEIDRNLPVYTFWDLGISDATAIWFLQPDGLDLKLVYYYEDTGKGFYHYAYVLDELRRTHGFKYKYHYAPHDSKQRQWGGNPRSTLQLAADCGISFLVAPNVGVEEGIQAVKAIFPQLWFHAKNCEKGIEALRDYHREWDEDRRCFKDKPFHSWSSHCFTGDTIIITKQGLYKIMDLPKTGEVLTLCGWKQYINPRITQKNAQLVEVVFKDGTTVRCTREHLFLTEKGWKFAKHLEKGTLIQSSLTQLRNTLMAHCIEYTEKKYILPKAVANCIEMLGKTLSEKFHQTVTFITKTVMLKTIYYLISNVCQQVSTCLFHGRNIKWAEPNTLPHTPENKLNYGINLKKEDYGINDLPKEQEIGLNGKWWRKNVWCVGKNLKPLTELADHKENIVATTAKPLIIESIKEIDRIDDVWCITVPEIEHFSLSNGAIVHNCSDSLRYMAVTWRESFQRPDLNAPTKYYSGF